jgi:hypothetical protein
MPGSRDWSRTMSFSGNVYYRHITGTFNGDLATDSTRWPRGRPRRRTETGGELQGFHDPHEKLALSRRGTTA